MTVARTLEELLYQLSRRVLLIERRLALRGSGGGGSGGVTPQPPASVSASLSTVWAVPSSAASPPWDSTTLTGGWIKTGNGVFTAPADGWVQVDALASINIEAATAAGNTYIALFQNGVSVAQSGERLSQVTGSGAAWAQTLAKAVKVTAGDTLEIRFRAQAGNPPTVASPLGAMNYTTMHYVTVGAAAVTVGGDLPDRLSVSGRRVTDLNSAIETGWYWGESPANAPNSSTAPWQVETQVTGPEGTNAGRIVQEAVLITTDAILRMGKWRRWFISGAWTAWKQTVPLSGVMAVTSSAGAVFKDTVVTIPAGYFLTPPNVVYGTQVNTSGTGLVTQAINVTATGWTARTATTLATTWTATYNVFWTAVPDPA